MSKPVLKPCPFCGCDDVELRDADLRGLVACNECGSGTGIVFLGSDEAANAQRISEVTSIWNKRTADQHIERLTSALEFTQDSVCKAYCIHHSDDTVTHVVECDNARAVLAKARGEAA